MRSSAIRDLLADGHLNRSLFDQVNLAEIASPDFPGERLIACYNPLLAEKRRRKRERLLAATEANLTKLARGVSRADQGAAVGGGDRREGGSGDRAAQDGQAHPIDDS